MALYSRDLREVIRGVNEGMDINMNKHNCELYDYTPLAHSIKAEALDVFQFLIRRGADINKTVYTAHYGYVDTPLWFAVDLRGYRFIEILLKKGAERTFKKGYSLLTYSIHQPDSRLFDCLMKNGEDVNENDEHGRTPLLSAVQVRNIDMAKTLLDYGAEFSIQSALFEAISTENLKIVELLTERGADPNFQSVTGFTPLTKATKIGNFEIAEALIKKGAVANMQDPEGNSPLINSVRLVHLDLVQLLVENGANVQQADGQGNHPITEALNTKSFPIIKYLIENGAKYDEDDCLPLILAIKSKNFDMLKFFLDRKVNVNGTDNNQKSPLPLAVETGNIRFAKLLIEHGASVKDVIEEIKQLATSSDNWKKFFEELEAERRILQRSIASNEDDK